MLHIPERFNPWAELDVEAPPDILTRFKLACLANDAELRHRVLGTTAMRYEHVAGFLSRVPRSRETEWTG
jgi:hypothetical protein